MTRKRAIDREERKGKREMEKQRGSCADFTRRTKSVDEVELESISERYSIAAIYPALRHFADS